MASPGLEIPKSVAASSIDQAPGMAPPRAPHRRTSRTVIGVVAAPSKPRSTLRRAPPVSAAPRGSSPGTPRTPLHAPRLSVTARSPENSVVASYSSIRFRPFHVVDHKHLHLPLLRFQPQSQLLLQRREDRGSVHRRQRFHARRQRPHRPNRFRRPLQREIVKPSQSRLIQYPSI